MPRDCAAWGLSLEQFQEVWGLRFRRRVWELGAGGSGPSQLRVCCLGSPNPSQMIRGHSAEWEHEYPDAIRLTQPTYSHNLPST